MNRLRVANANLDVCFSPKACRGIDRRAFNEGSSNGIEGRQPFPLAFCVQEIDNGAIEIALEQVVAACISGCLHLGKGEGGDQVCVRLLHDFYSVGTDQVKAEAKVDHRAYYERLICRLLCRPFLSPLDTTSRVRFPEVNPGAEPIIAVLAEMEWFVGYKVLANIPTAAVKT